jgi:hypothetical protein
MGMALIQACFGEISVAQRISRLRQCFAQQSSCALQTPQFHCKEHGCSANIERGIDKPLKYTQHDATLQIMGM